MKRKSLHASPCAIARTLDCIGDWWTLLILRDAFKGIGRFNALQKSLGIPRNILTTRLRMLVDRGILAIAPASDGSVYQEYVMTERGRGLVPVLVALRDWGERHACALDDTSMDDVSMGDAAVGDAALENAATKAAALQALSGHAARHAQAGAVPTAETRLASN